MKYLENKILYYLAETFQKFLRTPEVDNFSIDQLIDELIDLGENDKVLQKFHPARIYTIDAKEGPEVSIYTITIEKTTVPVFTVTKDRIIIYDERKFKTASIPLR